MKLRGRTGEEILREVRGRYESLELDFTNYKDSMKIIQEAVLPYHGRFLDGDTTKYDEGEMRQDKRVTSAVYQSAKTSSAAILDGLAPASRPWWLPTIYNDDLASRTDVYKWLTRQRDICMLAQDKSGLYEALANVMLEGFVFGTSIIYIWEDMDTIARAEVDTVGEYRLGRNEKGEIDSVYRDKFYTADSMVQLWGTENMPDEVMNAYNSNNPYEKFLVVQAIEPSRFFDVSKKGKESAEYESVYFLKDGSAKNEQPIYRKHFRKKPFFVNRFEVIGSNTYGNSIVREIIGEIKYLYDQAIAMAVSVESQAEPTLAAPAELKGLGNKLGKDRVIYYSQPSTAQSIKPIQENFVNISQLDAVIQRIEDRLKEAMLNNALKAITNITKEATRYEITKVYEEKMQILGGFVHRFNRFLSEIVERYWDICSEMGLLEPAPAVLTEGTELKVEFTSMLALAQRSIGASTIEQAANFVLMAAQVDQGIVDIADFEKHVRQYYRSISAPASLLRDEKEVIELRDKRAQQQQQMAAMENSKQMAEAANIANQTVPNAESLLASVGGAVNQTQ